MKPSQSHRTVLLLMTVAQWALVANLALAQTPPVSGLPLPKLFTYQGRLAEGVGLGNGPYDFRIGVHYNSNDEYPHYVWLGTNLNVPVDKGLFSMQVDMRGTNMLGVSKSALVLTNYPWLELSVRPSGTNPPDWTVLRPPQQMTPAPYASFAESAALGENAVTSNNLAAGAVQSVHLAPGAVTGPAIAYGQVVRSLNGMTENLTLTAGDGIRIDPATNGLLFSSPVNCLAYSNCYWTICGNGGTTPGTHFLGTTDNQPLELKVNGSRVLRLEPNSSEAPNVIGGARPNLVASGVFGATIAGGGAANYSGNAHTNQIHANFGTIGGGWRQIIQTGAPSAVIAGGYWNEIGTNANSAVIGGGRENSIGTASTDTVISGGRNNDIQSAAVGAAVGGGRNNTVQGDAAYAAIGGGLGNVVFPSISYATIPGGSYAAATNYGQQAYASGAFASPGDAQTSLYVVRNYVTNLVTTTNELFLDGTSQRMKIPRNSTWTFDAQVTARSSTGAGAGFRLQGVIENESGAVRFIGTVEAPMTAKTEGNLVGAQSFAEANNANDALVIKVVTPANSNAKWVGTVRTTEVIY